MPPNDQYASIIPASILIRINNTCINIDAGLEKARAADMKLKMKKSLHLHRAHGGGGAWASPDAAARLPEEDH